MTRRNGIPTRTRPDDAKTTASASVSGSPDDRKTLGPCQML